MTKNDNETFSDDEISLPKPRPGIEDISPYVPGRASAGKSDVEIHKLSSNESALGASVLAMEAFSLAQNNLHLYPDGGATQLRAAIAHYHKINPDEIICGAGSDEILQLLCRAYLGVGDNIVQTEHGFLVYALAARACGAQINFAPEENLTADVDSILDKVDHKTRLVFIANPNNPTGSYIPSTQMERLHRELREDIVLVIDAAYAEYMEEEDYRAGVELVEKNRNVIMTRTFSKIYGLGGLRLGWAYGPPGIIDILNRIRGPFNVSHAAQMAGIAAIKDQEFLRQNRDHNKSERAIMIQRLGGIGLECHPSFANFVLVKFPQEPGRSAADIQSYLASHGVMVREMTI